VEYKGFQWEYEMRVMSMEYGVWRMENGEWRMENGEWRMENGEWRMEFGVWSLEALAVRTPTNERSKEKKKKDYVCYIWMHLWCIGGGAGVLVPKRQFIS